MAQVLQCATSIHRPRSARPDAWHDAVCAVIKVAIGKSQFTLAEPLPGRQGLQVALERLAEDSRNGTCVITVVDELTHASANMLYTPAAHAATEMAGNAVLLEWKQYGLRGVKPTTLHQHFQRQDNQTLILRQDTRRTWSILPEAAPPAGKHTLAL
jgi:hypothetical protein